MNAAGGERHEGIRFRRHPLVEERVEGGVRVAERVQRVHRPVLLAPVRLELRLEIGHPGLERIELPGAEQAQRDPLVGGRQRVAVGVDAGPSHEPWFERCRRAPGGRCARARERDRETNQRQPVPSGHDLRASCPIISRLGCRLARAAGWARAIARSRGDQSSGGRGRRPDRRGPSPRRGAPPAPASRPASPAGRGSCRDCRGA